MSIVPPCWICHCLFIYIWLDESHVTRWLKVFTTVGTTFMPPKRGDLPKQSCVQYGVLINSTPKKLQTSTHCTISMTLCEYTNTGMQTRLTGHQRVMTFQKIVYCENLISSSLYPRRSFMQQWQWHSLIYLPLLHSTCGFSIPVHNHKWGCDDPVPVVPPKWRPCTITALHLSPTATLSLSQLLISVSKDFSAPSTVRWILFNMQQCDFKKINSITCIFYQEGTMTERVCSRYWIAGNFMGCYILFFFFFR